MALLAIAGCGSDGARPPADESEREVHIFYYPWHGNPETDGEWVHWTHPVFDAQGGSSGVVLEAPDDIGANFYPALGPYSNNDPEVVAAHARQMRDAGVDVVVASWWGPGGFEDRAIPLLLDQSERFGLRVAFHLETSWTSVAEVRDWIVYIVDRYGGHPAFYRNHRHGGRPMFYTYDSLNPARYEAPSRLEDWLKILAPDGENTIRGTSYDSIVVTTTYFAQFNELAAQWQFDGVYTYFAIDGFLPASTPANWLEMKESTDSLGLLFIPCVGPGYDDTRIRPFNAEYRRDREEGAYYERMFQAAIDADPPVIGITSFNEWHEGTQIEPAIPFDGPSFVFEDYAPLEPEAYLQQTRALADRYKKADPAPDATDQ